MTVSLPQMMNCSPQAGKAGVHMLRKQPQLGTAAVALLTFSPLKPDRAGFAYFGQNCAYC